MGIFRGTGKVIGQVAGLTVGGTAQLVGKVVSTKHEATGEWINEVGKGIRSASDFAFTNTGQLLDGTIQTTYGAIKKDAYHQEAGIHQLKDSAGKTINGIGNTVKYTAQNGKAVYDGFTEGDKQKAIQGIKNVGKVASVSLLAIGVLDVLIDSNVADAEAEEGLIVRNGNLGGEAHPVTGVPFVEKEFILTDGTEHSAAFPAFNSFHDVQLPEDQYLQSDRVHFAYANNDLATAIAEDPKLADELRLTSTDISILQNGDTPSGYSWHHSEDPGKMQLVNTEDHINTGHTGGREIWGGGTENR
ncbi:HNH endonuclease [Alkalicoccobacillus porphyridii]|nr:HNH endonuclease [Alkalicoccobacillus porphyridii]